MDSANRLAGQLWEFVVLLEVWCVGNCSVSVASGRIGWRPDLRVIAWNSSISHEGVLMIRLVGRGPGEEGAWGCGCVMCFSVTTSLLFLSAPSPQPDLLLLLHAAYQPFGEWAEL